MIEKNIDIEQLQQILNRKDNEDDACISLYDVANIAYDMQVSTETKYNIKDINHNFLINIASPDYISISTKNMYISINLMSKHNPERVEKNYNYICDSTLSNFLNENIEKFLRKVYIKINDCPIFFQTTLFNIRNQQLAKDNEEMKLTKKLERFRNTQSFFRRNND